jgi:hypothetical protein
MSILIDLERGGFLDPCFRLPFEFAVPDLLYRRELADAGGPALVARGLRVEELTADEVAIAQKVRSDHRRLSLPDAYAYALASARGWTLLTGDRELRDLAQVIHLPFFCVLWILDQFFDSALVEAEVIVAGLEVIAGHPCCRLPRTEIQIRLERWRR